MFKGLTSSNREGNISRWKIFIRWFVFVEKEILIRWFSLISKAKSTNKYWFGNLSTNFNESTNIIRWSSQRIWTDSGRNCWFEEFFPWNSWNFSFPDSELLVSRWYVNEKTKLFNEFDDSLNFNDSLIRWIRFVDSRWFVEFVEKSTKIKNNERFWETHQRK